MELIVIFWDHTTRKILRSDCCWCSPNSAVQFFDICPIGTTESLIMTFPCNCTDGFIFFYLFVFFSISTCVSSKRACHQHSQGRLTSLQSISWLELLGTRVSPLLSLSTATFMTKSMANPNSRGDQISPCLIPVTILNQLESDPSESTCSLIFFCCREKKIYWWVDYNNFHLLSFLYGQLLITN